MADVGYIRVSSYDQKLDRQLDGIALDEVFEDKASGKDMDRPGWKDCLRFLRKGDTLHVHSIDRLARSLNGLLATVTMLVDRGVGVHFHKENLVFVGNGDASPIQMLQLQMLGAVAQFERALIRERQEEGLQKAAARGVFRGRPGALSDEQAAELRKRAAAGEEKKTLAAEFGISRPTLYRYLSLS